MNKYFKWDMSQILLALGFGLFVFIAAGYYWLDKYPSPFASYCKAEGYCVKQ